MMIVFGSGGHTSEILMILKKYDLSSLNHLYFVKAETDTTSEKKARTFFTENNVKIDYSKVYWMNIPRSREVKQSYLSSIFTTIKSLLFCFFALQKNVKNLDLLVCNGPGTCLPIIAILFIQEILFMRKNVKTIFFESFCRVKSLSLTGKLVHRFVDT